MGQVFPSRAARRFLTNSELFVFRNYRKNANDGFPILCRQVFYNKRTTLFSTVLYDENRVVLFAENLYVKNRWHDLGQQPVPYRKLQ